MSQKYGTSIWFDIPVNNLQKAAGFYSELFGWKFSPMSETYHLIEVEGEHIGGLSLESEKPGDNNGPIIYIKVSEIEGIAKKVQNMGGRLVSEKVFIGDAEGSFQHFRDLEGNRLSLWENKN